MHVIFIVSDFLKLSMKQKTMAEEKEEFKNLLNTAAIPVDVRKMNMVGGVAEHVFFETIIAYLARYLFKVEKRSLLELACIHAVSVPLMGGLAAPIDDLHPLGLEAPLSDTVMDGAKGVPGVFASVYICNTAMQGFHAPKLNLADILMTAGTKIITRPIVSFLYPNFGETLRNGMDTVDTQLRRERVKSRLLSKETV
jgi:hypothetical protein